MTTPFIETISYQENPTFLFGKMRLWRWAQLLDSHNCNGASGRYDILVADPALRIVTHDAHTEVIDHTDQLLDQDINAFESLEKYLALHTVSDQQLPFYGGALGYFGYDLNDVLAGLKVKDQRDLLIDVPDMAIGIYHWAIVTDHQAQQTCFVSIEASTQAQNRLKTIKHLIQKPFNNEDEKPLYLVDDKLEEDTSFETYAENFQKIQDYLTAGDCYQANYARCFYGKTAGSVWQSYLKLRDNNPVPFGAFLDFPFAQIISASPERFLKVQGKQVETCPIKGTRPRSSDNNIDELNRQQLHSSDKDRAENLMIVDLMRNDLGKTCEPGSIKVPELFQVEAFPTVFHMISTVTGSIAEGFTALDVLKNCFPGGSITGAPKKRAMEIIAELEKYKRGIYCGAIGYISFNGNMDTNIAIRTMTVSNHQLQFWAGGGIVSDSEVNKEFEETRDKAKAFVDMLQPQN